MIIKKKQPKVPYLIQFSGCSRSILNHVTPPSPAAGGGRPGFLRQYQKPASTPAFPERNISKQAAIRIARPNCPACRCSARRSSTWAASSTSELCVITQNARCLSNTRLRGAQTLPTLPTASRFARSFQRAAPSLPSSYLNLSHLLIQCSDKPSVISSETPHFPPESAPRLSSS